MAIELIITPAGRLAADADGEDANEDLLRFTDELKASFDRSSARGLLCLAAIKPDPSMTPPLVYWRDYAVQYLTRLCQSADLDADCVDPVPPPEAPDLDRLAEQAPPMTGLEYLNREVLLGLWDSLDERVREEIEDFKGTAREYIKERHPMLHLLGRVTFHLAENKRDPECPFAFMATYTHRISSDAKLQHLPLGRALKEYSGAKNRRALLSLLEPVKRAGERSEVARELADTGDLFHPLAWTPQEAHRFLKDIPVFEESGIVVRLPDWWKKKGPSRPAVRVSVGNKPSNRLGMDSMLDFSVDVTLNGERLTREEIETILQSTHGLTLLKGQWVEVDRDQLSQVLDHWTRLEQSRSGEGLTFIEGMRLLSGASLGQKPAEEDSEAAREWSTVHAGDWLRKVLEEIQDPRSIQGFQAPAGLNAELRDYQRDGVKWLWLMTRLGLGACLADDMGLGKTVQVLALMLRMQQENKGADSRASTLLVLPASLIGNWQSEIQKFAPSLKVFIAHPSAATPETAAVMAKDPASLAEKHDLIVTTYSLVHRQDWLSRVDWRLVVLDEAQAIKNPSTRQTRALKKLNARVRIALTGTPVENRLSDLWSLFDFICPGLLGSAKVFSQFSKSLNSQTHPDFTPLRALVRPYILRRLKTDKTIIKDLPDKTELKTFCSLSKKQAVLYQQAVEELARAVETTDSMQRRGVILAFLLRFKQICNHPSQWLNDDAYDPEQSGKFGRLTELCEEIAAKQEKALIFTQFRQIIEPLNRFLAAIFRRSGLVLHGATQVKKRKSLVDAFQQDHGPPYFILSVKAGGTGLNLTAASHVIHFDRWWNPAVENQATDRAFRIGQHKNVLVHKLVCRGTIEERVDQLIEDKKGLARDLLEEGGETLLTEMDNDRLLKFVSLDIHSALQE